MQRFRDSLDDSGTAFSYVVEQASRLADSDFQDTRSLVNEQRWQCGRLNE